MSKIKELLRNKTIKNAKWMVAEQLVQMGINVILGVLTARYLGPSNYGVINYTAAFVIFFSNVVTLGLEAVSIKEMVNNRDDDSTVVGTGIGLRLMAGTLSTGIIFVLLFVLKDGNPLVLKVGFLQSLVMIFKAFELIDYWFQSKLQSKYVAILKSVSYVFVAAYKFYILFAGKSVAWFAFSTSLDFLLIAVMIVIAYFAKGGRRLRFSWNMAKRLVSQGYHFMISGLIITIYVQMDKIMLGQMMTEADVGLYSAATVISNYWLLIPVAIINAVRPTIMEIKKEGNEELYIKRLKQLYAILIWVGIAVSTVISVSSKLILDILYDTVYLSASVALAVVIWYTTFSTLGTARGVWIVCENKNKYTGRLVFWGVILNFILNYLLIPIMGINGAALATLITQIFTSIITPLFYKETRINTKYIIDAFLLRGIR